MRKSRSSLSFLLVCGLILAAAPLNPTSVSAAVDPLVADSLEALDSLVSESTCTLRDAADDDPSDGNSLPYRHCNDGVPPSGGGSAGIPVPVKYKADANGDDYTGLPQPASQEEVAAADAEHDLQPESDNRITLDVNISLPTSHTPTAGFPVIVFMHGCCGGNKTGWESPTIDPNPIGSGQKWHHSNSWFASRGYVVITYTARGFRNSNNAGSTGTTQLDSRRYEINDYQYLVGLLADHDAQRRAVGEKPIFKINPRKVATVGGSYGGGFSWMALTDPTWRSPASGVSLRLGAVVAKYGWTDLLESLVPGGHYFDRNPETGKTWIAPVDPAKAPSASPIGVEKQSFVAGLYGTGNNASGDHTTFPTYVHEAFARLQQGEPYEGDATLEAVADSFLNDRSAYFQEAFWKRVANGLRVPLFSAATWTDHLFPAIEHVRFHNKVKKVAPNYPTTMYLGDYDHEVANKAKEWADMCGEDHHVCTLEDYIQGSNGKYVLGKPVNRVRKGVNTRINRWLDYFLKGKGMKPAFNVAATTTVCNANASAKFPADEPGIEYRAATWRGLAPELIRFGWKGGGAAEVTSSSIATDAHAAESDPIFRGRQAADAKSCYSTTQVDPGPGVVQYVSEPIEEGFTMMGIPTVELEYETTATNYWISARLFDQYPNGQIVMVTRKGCRVNSESAAEIDCTAFDLMGNGWTFEKGHRIVLELSQADTPYLRRNNIPSTITFSAAAISLPTAPPSRIRDPRV